VGREEDFFPDNFFPDSASARGFIYSFSPLFSLSFPSLLHGPRVVRISFLSDTGTTFTAFFPLPSLTHYRQRRPVPSLPPFHFFFRGAKRHSSFGLPAFPPSSPSLLGNTEGFRASLFSLPPTGRRTFFFPFGEIIFLISSFWNSNLLLSRNGILFSSGAGEQNQAFFPLSLSPVSEGWPVSPFFLRKGAFFHLFLLEIQILLFPPPFFFPFLHSLSYTASETGRSVLFFSPWSTQFFPLSSLTAVFFPFFPSRGPARSRTCNFFPVQGLEVGRSFFFFLLLL